MKKLLIALMVAPFLYSCDEAKFTSDYDKSADFTSFKTFGYYGWQEESDKILNRFDKERIEVSVRKEFESRGMKFVPEGTGVPDVVVALYIVVDTKTSRTAYTTHMGGMGMGYGGWGWGGGASTTSYNEYDYLVGSFIISVFDHSKKQLVWEGVVSGTIDDNPKSREKNTPKVVKRMFADYPVKPIKTK